MFLTGGGVAAKRTRGWETRDTLAECELNRAALVRHELSRRIRERKGESKPAFKSKWIIDLGWLVSNK